MKKLIFTHEDMMMRKESRKMNYRLQGYSNLEIRMAEGEALRREAELIRMIKQEAEAKDALVNRPFADYDPFIADVFKGMISSLSGRPAIKENCVVSLPTSTVNKTYWVAKPVSGVRFTTNPTLDEPTMDFVELTVKRGWIMGLVEVEAGYADHILGIVDLAGFIDRLQKSVLKNTFKGKSR